MQTRLLVIVLAFAAVALFVGVLGCNKRGSSTSSTIAPPTLVDLPSLPKHVTLDKTAHSVSWPDSQLPVGISDADKSQIHQLVGRIPGITYEVLSVSACWDDIPVALRLRVREGFLFLVKDDRGAWVLSVFLRVRSVER
jgi:hypothetical protein